MFARVWGVFPAAWESSFAGCSTRSGIRHRLGNIVVNTAGVGVYQARRFVEVPLQWLDNQKAETQNPVG